VDDDVTIVLAYLMYTARKKAGPKFFQPISKLQFKNMKPNSKITIPYIFIILYTQLE
jgi:hypothetical protein